ncbi:MAG: Aminomethyltransferase folate-binding domain [Solirubrobacteraceae bacterium]|nr:Aminomethyltransferase folate-binding domain [Solirubrobacteraceae bacterium]
MNTGSVPEACLAAGAQLGERDGHVVAALYGSTPGEIAACMSHVGLADRSDLGAIELRGGQAPLDRALATVLGDPPPAAGTARRQRGIWYLRVDSRRCLVVGAHHALRDLAPAGAGSDRSELVSRDIGASIAIVSVIGPRAGRLLGAAGLPDDLGIGAIGRDAGDPSVVAILRESQRRVLVLVRTASAEAFWARLLEAGEPLGAAFVGCDALTLLGAASVQAPV